MSNVRVKMTALLEGVSIETMMKSGSGAESFDI